ncbi:hypothetical protein GPECTOR_44g44 [Gonium pectorale]|uniref:Protein kinase domain-containing protein n=1 Tax=Gonium pectorale TaxID=33097 RepID=A0A150G946_GONPE|nr:hypothetical protein GPECTOR_44g44 [Gonium pectorale]|eukprot:KXZ46367.1 hypothetical protein GPECTOR_44g44 [Gonium pectorale]
MREALLTRVASHPHMVQCFAAFSGFLTEADLAPRPPVDCRAGIGAPGSAGGVLGGGNGGGSGGSGLGDASTGASIGVIIGDADADDGVGGARPMRSATATTAAAALPSEQPLSLWSPPMADSPPARGRSAFRPGPRIGPPVADVTARLPDRTIGAPAPAIQGEDPHLAADPDFAPRPSPYPGGLVHNLDRRQQRPLSPAPRLAPHVPHEQPLLRLQAVLAQATASSPHSQRSSQSHSQAVNPASAAGSGIGSGGGGSGAGSAAAAGGGGMPSFRRRSPGVLWTRAPAHGGPPGGGGEASPGGLLDAESGAAPTLRGGLAASPLHLPAACEDPGSEGTTYDAGGLLNAAANSSRRYPFQLYGSVNGGGGVGGGGANSGGSALGVGFDRDRRRGSLINGGAGSTMRAHSRTTLTLSDLMGSVALDEQRAPFATSELWEVLVAAGAQPGRHCTIVIMEMCDQGTLQQAIQRRCFCAVRTSSFSAAAGSAVGGAVGSTTAAVSTISVTVSTSGVVLPAGPGPGPAPSAAAGLLALLRTALEVAQGMCHLHSLDIVHGDLKPNNVLLQSNTVSLSRPTSMGHPWEQDLRGYSAKVADFGLAALQRGSPSTTRRPESLLLQQQQQQPLTEPEAGPERRWGSLAYMAPEVPEKGPSKKSDVWSYGMLLYAMCCGKAPYHSYSHLRPTQLLMGIVEGSLTLEWPEDTYRLLRRLAEACCSRDPAARPPFSRIVPALQRLLRHVAKHPESSGAARSGPSSSLPLVRSTGTTLSGTATCTDDEEGTGTATWSQLAPGLLTQQQTVSGEASPSPLMLFARCLVLPPGGGGGGAAAYTPPAAAADAELRHSTASPGARAAAGGGGGSASSGLMAAGAAGAFAGDASSAVTGAGPDTAPVPVATHPPLATPGAPHVPQSAAVVTTVAAAAAAAAAAARAKVTAPPVAVATAASAAVRRSPSGQLAGWGPCNVDLSSTCGTATDCSIPADGSSYTYNYMNGQTSPTVDCVQATHASPASSAPLTQGLSPQATQAVVVAEADGAAVRTVSPTSQEGLMSMGGQASLPAAGPAAAQGPTPPAGLPPAPRPGTR